MSAKLIAVANMKGGVGKTATVVSIAETLAARAIDKSSKSRTPPKPILVVDLDAQASASFALAGNDLLTALIRPGKTVDGFLDRYFLRGSDQELADFIQHQVSAVTHGDDPLAIDLLASSPDLRKLERGLIHGLTSKGYSLAKIEDAMYELLGSRINTLRPRYDYIIFDCPPGISILTEVAIRIADLTIVPTIPDFLSVLGLDAFEQNVWSQLATTAAANATPLKAPYVLVTKRKNLRIHNLTVADLRERVENRKVKYYVFKTEIPESQDVPKAVELIESFPTYSHKWGNMRTQLSALATEIETELNRRR